jgi:hypothetical protein
VTYAGQISHTSQANRGIEIITGTGTISFSNTLQIGTVGSPMLSAVGVFLDATGNANPITFADLNIITGTGGGASSQAFVSQTSGRIAVTTGDIDCNGNLGADTHCFDVSDTTSDGVTFATFLSDHDDAGEAGGSIFLNNTPGTFTFQEAIRMTGLNARIIQATNFGTLNIGTVVTGNVVTQNRPAVDINTGAINITATTVSMFGGAANGIIIQNTTGSFTVTGTGAAGTGGTIANTTGADGSTDGIGIYLNNATNITLNDMQLNDHPNFAVAGNNVTNFVMDNTVINGVNGNNATFNEGGVQFGGLFGTSVISNSTINGAFEYPVFISNTSGASNITISSSTIGLNDTANGTDGMFLFSSGTSDMTAFVTGNTFVGARVLLLRASNGGNAQLRLTVNGGNQFHNTHPSILEGGILIENFSTGFARVLFTGNTQRGSITDALRVLNESTGTMDATITSNTFGVPATPNSSATIGSSIVVRTAQNAGEVTTLISNNFVHQYNTIGIYLLLGSPSAVAGGAGSYRATVVGNTVSNPGAFALNGINLNSGNVGGDTFTSCIDINANNMVGSGFGGGTDFRVRQRQSTTVTIPGYGGAANDIAAVVAFIQSVNPGAETGSATVNTPPGGGFINGGACATPVLP